MTPSTRSLLSTETDSTRSCPTLRWARELFCTLALAAGVITTASAADLVPTLIGNRGDGKTVAIFKNVGTGTWTIPAGVENVEVLVVGGGGGSSNWSGGCGAGGMYFTNSYAVVPGTSVTITTGAGGTAGGGDGDGGDGQTSQFGDQLIAYGGIHGMGYNTAGGGNQGGYSIDGGTTIVAGSAPAEPRDWGWWSGSGAGAPGTVGDSAAGGMGAPCSITGAEVYYAGGGGANAHGTGGLGGGGDGSTEAFVAPPQAGAPNTGGGAGGGWGGGGATGGSGVVMVAFTSSATYYTVSFDSTGGSAVADQSIEAGGTATAPTPAPTKTGYTFVEWCTDNTLANAFNFSTPITGNTTVYAKWVTNWVVTFDSNGGSAVEPQSVSPGTTASEPAAPTQTGYTFAGWYSDSGLTNGFDFATAITADTTIYAKWTINSYTLTYAAGDNGTLEGVTSQTVDYDGSGTAVTAVANSGYEFVKWSDDSTSNPRTDSHVTADLSVTAVFELLPQPITPDSLVSLGESRMMATFSTVRNGLWTIPDGVTSVEVLVVGGGGGGGFWTGGGGGGGFYYSNAYPVTAGSVVAVTVGAGGAKNEAYQTNAGAGGKSVFAGVTANGGGGGTTVTGGASGSNNQGADGFPGGTDLGAGGGAGEAGDNGWYAAPNNNGGDGLACAITGTSTYYGGGGSAFYNGAHGGLGGGGSTKDDNNGGIADPNGVNGLGGGGAAARDAGIDAGNGGSGIVIVIYGGSAPAGQYATWTSKYPGANLSDPAADLDGDGLSNQQEFAFGLNPTQGGSTNPIASGLQSNGQFSYTRTANSGLTYTVWTSTDLQNWTLDSGASQTAAAPVDGVETVSVTVTNPPANGKLFVRVQAQ